MEQVYICDAHGAGTKDCCKEAENIGWYEERIDTEVQVETATRENLGGLYTN